MSGRVLEAMMRTPRYCIWMGVVTGAALLLAGCVNGSRMPVPRTRGPEPRNTETELAAMGAGKKDPDLIPIEDHSHVRRTRRPRFWSRPETTQETAPSRRREDQAAVHPAARLHVRLGADGRFTEIANTSTIDAVGGTGPELVLVGDLAQPECETPELPLPAPTVISTPPAEEAAPPVMPRANPQARDASATRSPAAKPRTMDETLRARGFNPDAKEYLIRAGDSLEVSIPYEKETGRIVPVRPDGRITYLFDIEVMAAGRTYAEVREILKAKLGDYYRNPRVTVIGRTFGGNSVFVMGPVRKPGALPIQNHTRLLDVLASAGVFGELPQTAMHADGRFRVVDRLDLDGAYVARDDRILEVNIKDMLLNRKVRDNNILMQPGDFIFIPSASATERKIYICGRVRQPQVYYFTGELTFMEAILEADGADTDIGASGSSSSDTARAHKCYIIRGKATEPIEVDWPAIQMGQAPDVGMQPEDILYVPERSLSRVSRATTRVISDIIAPLRAILDAHGTAQDYYQRNWQLPSRGKARLK